MASKTERAARQRIGRDGTLWCHFINWAGFPQGAGEGFSRMNKSWSISTSPSTQHRPQCFYTDTSSHIQYVTEKSHSIRYRRTPFIRRGLTSMEMQPSPKCGALPSFFFVLLVVYGYKSLITCWYYMLSALTEPLLQMIQKYKSATPINTTEWNWNKCQI